MSSSFWAGYYRESPDRYRRGRDVVEFSADGLHATVRGPEGQHTIEGEGACLLRSMLEEDRDDGFCAESPGVRSGGLSPGVAR